MRKFVSLLLVSIFTIALVAALGVVDIVSKGEVFNRANEDPINTAALFPIIPVPRVLVPDTPLPKSLDNLFPPIAPGPIWLLKMFEMGGSLMSIADDTSEGEMQNAADDFKKFKAKYEEIRELVPEWKAFFPMYPVNSLEAALKSGNQTKINAAFANMGQVCENCHIVNMPKVQYKYHWKAFDGKTFSEINVKDPQTNTNISFIPLMWAIDINFNGVGIDLRQNQIDKAKAHFQGLNATFQMMKETCKSCHTTERKYYVDSSAQAMVDDLGQALNEMPVNSTKVETLMQGIGMESCLKCHWVHVPAAFAQRRER